MKHYNDQYYNGNKLRDVGAPSLGTDAANKTYVDQSIAGLDLQCPSVACKTSASTQAKVGKCKDFSLNNPCYVFVNIKNANSYDGKITLNINSTGAKDVYINGTVSSSTNKTLPAGTYIVYYNGQYHFRTDGKLNINGVPFGGSYNDLTNRPSLATVATSGSYNDLSNKPTIPTKVSQLTNDTGFITESGVPKEIFLCTYSNGSMNKTVPQIYQAYNDGKVVLCRYNNGSYNCILNMSYIEYLDLDVADASDAVSIIFSATSIANAGIIYSEKIEYVGTYGSGTWNYTYKAFATVATSGSYNDLSNKPSLANVAKSGSYNDLTNKPTIPAAQIQSDWNQTNSGSKDYIKNKPSLASVATSGSYNDLSNKPAIPSAPGTLKTDNTTAQAASASEALSDTINLHKVSKTGNYGDLIDTPSFKTINNNSIIGSGDVHISGDIVFLTATPAPNSTYKLSKTPAELTNLCNSGFVVVVKVSGRLFYLCYDNTPHFISASNYSNYSVCYQLVYNDNQEAGVNTPWYIRSINLQAQLIGSGTGQNIKTVNGNSLLGSGDVTIATGENNVQSDWNVTDTTSDAYIKNKPTILSNYDFTHTANTTVSTSTKTITYAANQRGSQMISVSADLALTFAVNNYSDNYLWIKNTGSSEVDITVSAVTKSGGTTVSNVYLPADGISIPAGKVCEIGIVVNADGAFITSRNDLSL